MQTGTPAVTTPRTRPLRCLRDRSPDPRAVLGGRHRASGDAVGHGVHTLGPDNPEGWADAFGRGVIARRAVDVNLTTRSPDKTC